MMTDRTYASTKCGGPGAYRTHRADYSPCTSGRAGGPVGVRLV